MTVVPQNRFSPARVVLPALLIVIAAALSLSRFRPAISAGHDPGFTRALPLTSKLRSHDGARPIRNAPGQFVTLEPTGKFLINSITGKPVFITGDAAWSLITQLDDADVDLYLSDRASRGFNYIWCAAADNFSQTNAPKNFYGGVPFDGADFTHEDPKYWAHVDDVIHRAATHGITVALSPAFVGLYSPGGYLASIQASSEELLAAYGEFLGDRYKNFPNIIWVVGGDVDPATGVVPKINALAVGIRSKDTVHLIVAEGEPQRAALDTLSDAPWMDLNWLYFHTTNIPSNAAANYSRSPWLPPLQGEGWYENEHSATPLGLREQGYWAVLSGAYPGNGGFGNRPLWYFNGAGFAQHGEPNWQSQLNSEGSVDQMYLGKLFRSREHWKLVPDTDHTVMTAGYDSRSFSSSAWETVTSLVHRQPYRLGSESAVAARTSDGQTIIAYIPSGSAATITVDMSKITDATSQAKSWWFNPKTGSATLIGIFLTKNSTQFTPPDRNDWILVIDSFAANLPSPGMEE
jgi:hypothetical protein